MMRLIRNSKAFTLVEILIVVAILGLLAAIAVPNLMRARVDATQTACRANQKAIEKAIATYLVREDKPIPSADIVLNTAGSFASGVYDPVTAGYIKVTDPFTPGTTTAYVITIKADTGQVLITGGL